MKMFIDQATHLPLMLTYEGAAAADDGARRAGQGRASGRRRKRSRRCAAEPPQMAIFEVRYSEYKKVDGVLLPHLITTGANGNVTEEWTIEKFKINPALKPESFVKKGS